MTGYMILILGLALWWLPHLFKRLLPEARERLGLLGKGLVAIALLVSIWLMVVGLGQAAHVGVWSPPAFLTHANNLLMVFAFWLWAVSYRGYGFKFVHGRIAARLRHPQLTAVKIWAVAHLLVNGDLASIVLFGGLLAWAVVEVIVINRSEPRWTPPRPGPVIRDVIALLLGLGMLAAVAAVHAWLGVTPFG